MRSTANCKNGPDEHTRMRPDATFLPSGRYLEAIGAWACSRPREARNGAVDLLNIEPKPAATRWMHSLGGGISEKHPER